MRFLHDNRNSKVTVSKVTAPDGKVFYRTGVTARWQNTQFQRTAAQNGWRVEQVPNPVFEGRFRMEGGEAVDVDTGAAYSLSEGTMGAMLRAVAAGVLRGERGALAGTFTLAKEGCKVSLAPWTGGARPEAPGEAPADAPDLSDFVAALGPAKGRR